MQSTDTEQFIKCIQSYVNTLGSVVDMHSVPSLKNRLGVRGAYTCFLKLHDFVISSLSSRF